MVINHTWKKSSAPKFNFILGLAGAGAVVDFSDKAIHLW